MVVVVVAVVVVVVAAAAAVVVVEKRKKEKESLQNTPQFLTGFKTIKLSFNPFTPRIISLSVFHQRYIIQYGELGI